MLLAFVAQRATPTNLALAAAAPAWVDARILTPERAAAVLGLRDAAVGRLDVAGSLDGVEDGLWALGTLAAGGIRVLNRAGALLAVHDKLLTARVQGRDGLPHPRTRMLHPEEPAPPWNGPVVVKRSTSPPEYRIDWDPFAATMSELARVAREGMPAFAAA